MARRTLLKWLHWLAAGLMLYFIVTEPDVSERATDAQRTAELSTHAGVGMLLAVVALIWLAAFWRTGPIGRPGPKLPALAKRAHRLLNTGLYWLLPFAVASGGLAGLASEYPVNGFGIVPLNPSGWGTETLHDIAEEIHEIAFNLTLLVIVAHTSFHLWRQFVLKDNALRIMLPRALHKFL